MNAFKIDHSGEQWDIRSEQPFGEENLINTKQRFNLCTMIMSFFVWRISTLLNPCLLASVLAVPSPMWKFHSICQYYAISFAMINHLQFLGNNNTRVKKIDILQWNDLNIPRNNMKTNMGKWRLIVRFNKIPHCTAWISSVLEQSQLW